MNTQDNKILYPRGSEWRKWDLHIHTKDISGYAFSSNSSISSRERSDAEYTKVFVEHIYTIDNLGVIAITDHNSADWIDKIIKESKNFARQNKREEITILPGIEVESSDGIHLLIIFNPKTQFKKVKRNYRKTTWKETIEHFLTVIGVTQGSNASKTTEDIMETAEKWDALCIFAHATSDKGFFRISSGNTKKRIYRHRLTQIFQMPLNSNLNNGQKDIIEGRDPNYYDEQEKPKSIVCITASDAKGLSNIGTNNCWVKANPTFEGLKEIIYEPEERVKTQEDNPEPLKSLYSIDSVKISNAVINRNLSMRKTEIPLNRNLVAVIGGKGSGKTALLDLIANYYLNKIDPSNKNSFVNRIFNEGQNLVTDIKFLNQEKFSKKLAEQKFVMESDIEYIPQGQIENKIGNIKEFHNFLQNLIFKGDKVRNSTAYFEYQENEKVKKEIKNKIEILNQEIFTIETQIKNEDVDDINKQLKFKETEKGDIQNKINLAKKLFTKERLEEIDKIQGKLSAFKDQRNKLSNLHHLIKATIEKFVEIENLNKNLGAIKDLANELELKDTAVQLIKYEDIKGQIENIGGKVSQKLVSINENIEQTQNKIEKLQKDKKEYIVLLNKSKEIDIAINSIKKRQKDVSDLQKSLSEKIEKRWELYKELLDTNLIFKKKYKEIIDLFSEDTYGILAGIEFKSSLIFDFKNFAEIGEDILDLRTVRESKTQKVSLLESELLKDIINALKEIIKIESNNSGIDKLTEIMKQKIAELLKIKKSTRTNEHLYEWFFEDYFSLNTEIYFNKIFLEKLSLGQKCTVLLKVYLAQGENPIFIDQPDDNLDNEFIMEELIQAIRKAKTNRQVVIASNNANVVINSDAEQIIVAEYKNGEISYIPGAIENPTIREKAIKILEGGRTAFEAREKKYAFK